MACARCGCGVYNAEDKIALNKIWHKCCFCCYKCKKPLEKDTAKVWHSEIFCDCCFPCPDPRLKIRDIYCEPKIKESIFTRPCRVCSSPSSIACSRNEICFPSEPLKKCPSKTVKSCSCIPDDLNKWDVRCFTYPLPREVANYYNRRHMRDRTNTCPPQRLFTCSEESNHCNKSEKPYCCCRSTSPGAHHRSPQRRCQSPERCRCKCRCSSPKPPCRRSPVRRQCRDRCISPKNRRSPEKRRVLSPEKCRCCTPDRRRCQTPEKRRCSPDKRRPCSPGCPKRRQSPCRAYSPVTRTCGDPCCTICHKDVCCQHCCVQDGFSSDGSAEACCKMCMDPCAKYCSDNRRKTPKEFPFTKQVKCNCRDKCNPLPACQKPECNRNEYVCQICQKPIRTEASGEKCWKPILKCTTTCVRCGEKVYAAEKVLVAGGAYHTACFSCCCCRKALELKNVHEHCNEIYCKQCYNNVFGIRYYGFGNLPSC